MNTLDHILAPSAVGTILGVSALPIDEITKVLTSIIVGIAYLIHVFRALKKDK